MVLSWLSVTYSPCWTTWPCLSAKEGALSRLNLMCYTLCKSMWGRSLSEWRWRSSVWGGGRWKMRGDWRGGGRGNLLVCKVNEKQLFKQKINIQSQKIIFLLKFYWKTYRWELFKSYKILFFLSFYNSHSITCVLDSELSVSTLTDVSRLSFWKQPQVHPPNKPVGSSGLTCWNTMQMLLLASSPHCHVSYIVNGEISELCSSVI